MIMRYRSGNNIQAWVVAITLAMTSVHAAGWRASHLPGSAPAMSLAGGGRALPANMLLSGVNPAHVWQDRAEQVEYGHLKLFAGSRGHTFRWHAGPQGKPTQIVLQSVVDDDLELRGTVPTAEPLAKFQAWLMTATLNRGITLGGTRLGIGITAAYERIYVYSARAAWFSIGWQGAFNDWLSWGVSVQNLGIAADLNRQNDPVGLRSGAGLAARLPGDHYLSLDLVNDDLTGLMPVAGWYHQGVLLTTFGGMRLTGNDILLSGGFSLLWKAWSLSYALAYQDSQLGIPTIFTLARSF